MSFVIMFCVRCVRGVYFGGGTPWLDTQKCPPVVRARTLHIIRGASIHGDRVNSLWNFCIMCWNIILLKSWLFLLKRKLKGIQFFVSCKDFEIVMCTSCETTLIPFYKKHSAFIRTFKMIFKVCLTINTLMKSGFFTTVDFYSCMVFTFFVEIQRQLL